MDPGSPAAVLLNRWLEGLQALDLEGVLALYHPDAVLDGESGPWRGREEISRHIHRLARKVRGLQVQVLAAASTPEGLTFVTHIRSRLGEAHFRHAWSMADHRILHHGIQAWSPLEGQGVPAT